MFLQLVPREVDWLLKRALDARFDVESRPHSPEIDNNYNSFLDGIINKMHKSINEHSPVPLSPVLHRSTNSSITIDHTGRLSK